MSSDYKHIAKGPVCAFLDKLSTGEDAAARLEALAKDLGQLKAGYAGLVGVLDKHLFKTVEKGRRKAINEYLRKHWFDARKGWWGHLQPIAPVYAEGIKKAIEASLGKGAGKKKSAKSSAPLPIDSYWIAVDDRLELTVMQSPRQVTLLIMTPRPPGPVKMGGIGDLDTIVSIVARDEPAMDKRPVVVDTLRPSTQHMVRK